ncbi:unnamed protein product [Porites lobata]|uniref:Uncharacterized protein n=1 Tax=Porites lobata TaxID=104759 RepID=A0ABN8RB00_9CNID|nr:unnamed protein product [Porites lobata]
MGCTSNQSCGIRYNTASIQLCSLCVWTKAPLDIFFRTLPDIAPFLEPLERAIADLLVPAITEHVTTQEERDLLELPVRLGGLGLVNPARTASQEYEASVKITGPLVRQIVKQAHEPPDETEIKTLQANARREKDELLKMQCEQVRESLPSKTERAVELATEKGASNWLTVIPIKEMNFNLNIIIITIF